MQERLAIEVDHRQPDTAGFGPEGHIARVIERERHQRARGLHERQALRLYVPQPYPAIAAREHGTATIGRDRDRRRRFAAQLALRERVGGDDPARRQADEPAFTRRRVRGDEQVIGARRQRLEREPGVDADDVAHALRR